MIHITWNLVAWVLAGIPAIIACIGYGAAVLLAPHLAVEPVPLMWSFWGVIGWLCILLVCIGGDRMVVFIAMIGSSQ